MATLDEALAAKRDLESKFSSEEPWKESYRGIGIGRDSDGIGRYVTVFVKSEVPNGTYPTEHNNVRIVLRLDPEAILHSK